MTTNDIDAIRKLTDAATPGPWRAIVPLNETDDWFDPFDDPMVVTSDSTPGNYCAIAQEICNGEPEGVADAEFIAAARTHVPALCDEVEQLRAEKAKMRATIEAFEETHGNAVYLAANLAAVRNERDEFYAELDKARAELARLSKVAEAAKAWRNSDDIQLFGVDEIGEELVAAVDALPTEAEVAR